jgi:GTPase
MNEQELNIENQVTTIPIAPEGFKSGFVAIVGRPNVGKSTLMNHLIGQKIAITSPIAQTTRNRLQGILTTPEAQIIFVDTPGIHKPHHELGKVLVQNAKTAIKYVDLVLFVVDSSTEAGTGDRFVVDILKRVNTPVILGLNKVDLQPNNYQFIDDTYAELIANTNWSTVKFSATVGTGTKQLQKALINHLEPGPYYYPPDLVTDQPERFIMAELIREQILLHTRQEIPHSVAITIEKIVETPKITKINAAIILSAVLKKELL